METSSVNFLSGIFRNLQMLNHEQLRRSVVFPPKVNGQGDSLPNRRARVFGGITILCRLTNQGAYMAVNKTGIGESQ